MTSLPIDASNVIATRNLDQVDGFDLIAYEVVDADSSPIGEEVDNGGCYTSEDIEAWRRDEWYYAGVVVVASRAGIPLGSSDIWGCSTGDYWDRGDGTYRELLASDDFAHGYGADLIAEAISEARATLAQLGVV